LATLFIIDDDPDDRAALRRCLERTAHVVVECDSGEAALARAEAELPDLVLTDIMLPGIHGFETARRLKTLAGERYLPIVLVSGLTDHSSRALGAHLGLDGFVTKPVDGAEILAAVENLLARKAEQAALEARNAELRERARLREELSALIVHDIKSPLSVALASLDLAEEVAPQQEDLRESLQDARAATLRILRLLNNLLDVARSEASQLELRRETVDPLALLSEIGRSTAPLLRQHEVGLTVEGTPGLSISADRDVLTRVVENILDNAFRYAPRGGRIELRAHRVQDTVELRIGNDGAAIPEERRITVFEKFAGTKDGRGNLGLGMYFCRLACEAHGGRIWIGSEPGLPTVFVIALPA
jgi:signal transduction histidine kinase